MPVQRVGVRVLLHTAYYLYSVATSSDLGVHNGPQIGCMVGLLFDVFGRRVVKESRHSGFMFSLL